MKNTVYCSYMTEYFYIVNTSKCEIAKDQHQEPICYGELTDFDINEELYILSKKYDWNLEKDQIYILGDSYSYIKYENNAWVQNEYHQNDEAKMLYDWLINDVLGSESDSDSYFESEFSDLSLKESEESDNEDSEESWNEELNDNESDSDYEYAVKKSPHKKVVFY